MKNRSDISAKSWGVFAFFCLFAIGIMWRIFAIQFLEAENWSEAGSKYVHVVKDIQPTRGQIFSADGSLLATSIPIYELRWDSGSEAIDSTTFEDNLDALCTSLSVQFKDRTPEEYERFLREHKRKKSRYAPIQKGLDFTEMKVVSEFPFISLGKYKSGFIFERVNKRKKPFANLASRTIGIDREGSRVGLELAFNEELSGRVGKQVKQRMPGGVWKPVTDQYIIEPQEGLDVISTIDMHLQDVANNALKTQLEKHDASWGTVVLMEVNTGYIKAIANLQKDPISGTYDETFNLAIAESVEPGSTFKLPSIMAALDDGLVTLEDSIDTGKGIIFFHGSPMKDSNYKTGGHGKMTVKDVFAMSSNIGAALITKNSYEANPQAFLDKLSDFGCHDPMGIKIKGEVNPQLYRKPHEGNWSGLSITQMAIGYELKQTPIQILGLYNAIANNGKMMQPLFVSELKRNGVTTEEFPPRVINSSICSPQTIKACREMMEATCLDGGTADYVFAKSPYNVAGKTGTAKISHDGGYYENRYRASFVGYFPAEEPKYSCIVMINDTKSGVYYGSSIAAPVFKEVSDKIYATQFDLIDHGQIQFAEQTKIPVSKNGNSEDLIKAFEELQIPIDINSESDWVSTSTKADKVVIADKNYDKEVIPDVRGMGLQDAIYLLENRGLNVIVEGTGKINSQSIAPGTRRTQNNTIKLELS